MTIAFIRTYNNKQNSEVQEAVIREFAESQKIEIGKWAKEVGNSPRANRRLESIVKSGLRDRAKAGLYPYEGSPCLDQK